MVRIEEAGSHAGAGLIRWSPALEQGGRDVEMPASAVERVVEQAQLGFGRCAFVALGRFPEGRRGFRVRRVRFRRSDRHLVGYGQDLLGHHVDLVTHLRARLADPVLRDTAAGAAGVEQGSAARQQQPQHDERAESGNGGRSRGIAEAAFLRCAVGLEA
ncbi:MAG: hypothetical protein GEU74_07105 [Nitriliruptorales bacterium]|nr:hypothetical protein [Nitriliruptorales bacterium]